MATLQKFKNNATTTLAAGVDGVQTSIDVADATQLPTITGSEWFYLTITQPTGTTETAWEIVKVTAVAVNTLTVVRGQNGTSAQAWSSGSKAENRLVQADAAAFASPYRLSSQDDRSYIEIYDDYTLWSIQDVTVFYSNGVSSTQFYCPGETAFTSTGALSIYAVSGGLAFQTNVGGDIGFTAGYDPGALPSGVLRMAGLKVEFRGQTMDLIPPFTIGGEPPIQLRFYRTFSSITSVGFSASMTTDPAVDVVWQLPGDDGAANQAMVTDGAGLLSWRTVLSTPATANMVLTADGLGAFTAVTSAELEDGYLTLSGTTGPGIYIDGTGALGGGEIYLGDDGSGSFTGALSASNLSGTNTGDQDLSGLQPLDAQLTALAGLSYTGNAGKYIRVNGTENGFELATVSGGITVTDDTTTNATMYPLWATGTGATGTIYASTTDLSWNPSTNVLTVGGAIYSTQAVAATSTDGLVLATSATATSGNQKWSSAAHFKGSGWGTTGGAAQSVDVRVELRPIQSTTAQAQLYISKSVGGGAYGPMLTVDEAAGSKPGLTIWNAAGTTDVAQIDPHSNSGRITVKYNGGAIASLIANGVSNQGLLLCNVNHTFSIGSDATTGDTFLGRAAAANWRFGGAAANPPIAQTESVQNASGTNTAGALRYYVGSLATGNAASGGHAFQVGVPGASGTTLQTAETQLTIGYHTATWVDALDFVLGSTTGTKIGTATTQKLGFYNATPVVQPTNVTNPTGGGTIDTEARTAIDAILSRLEALGLFAA